MAAKRASGKSLVDQLEKAVADLSKGQFKGNLVELLTKASKQLTQQKAEVKQVETLNAKALSEVHRKFTERLSKILTVKIKAEDLQPGESVSYCYVGSWYHSSPRNDGREATITIRKADARVSTSEDIAPPYAKVHWGEYGAYRDLDNIFWTFPERWLWEDDWRQEFHKVSLETSLRMAQLRREDAIKHRDELLKKRVPDAEKEILDLTAKCQDLTARLKAGEQVPAEVE